ncbi:MAG: ABC transporter permease subunit [Phycisphaera sp.]|nr:MAG: ABC transporter permease subunit [Phycisphaera sp.]
MAADQPPKAKAGRHVGNRPVRRRVVLMDQLSGYVIQTGGALVLVAVLGICFYLAYVVVPLFSRGEVGERLSSETPMRSGLPVLDPYGRGVAFAAPDGTIQPFALATGQPLAEPLPLSEDQTPSAFSVVRNGELVAAGYDDGTVRLGSISFDESLLETEPPSPDQTFWAADGALYEMVTPNRARRSQIEIELGDAVELSEGEGGVVRLDYNVDPTGRTVLLAVRADGTVLVNTVRTIRPLGGGPPRTRLRSTSFAIDPSTIEPWLFVTSDSDHVLAMGEDGRVRRFSRSEDGFELAETTEGVNEGQSVTAATMILGGRTLLIGDDAGTVYAWHVATGEVDGEGGVQTLVKGHEFSGSDSAIVDIAPSQRDRSIVILGESGKVRVRHVTSEKIVAEFDTGLDNAVRARLAPKNDGVFVLDADGTGVMRALEPGYPEFSFKALFGRVHYEGQMEPEFVYQSSSGDDAAEIKLSVVPLIFGSLKATIFAMLFAVPMGVLAAVYTSEFLSPNVRKVVKPGVEMMASLPSVVLGFVAAIVVAPYVREWLPSVLVSLATVPVAVLLVAHLWQMLPSHVRKRASAWQHMGLVLLACTLGAFVAWAIGPTFERVLFSPPEGVAQGVPVDLRRWLSSEYGQAWPGWFVVLIGPVAVVLAVLQSMFLGRRLDRAVAGQSDMSIAGVMLVRFVVMLALVLALSFGFAHLLQALGFDPRNSIFGPFSPRNTLVVSMIMGFAVIPIIYTISEDSLRAVPDSLRTASLGAGATPWQTAMRIVIPVAGSGIFSACMIGFGRAAGETMIVLMATGNTPEMSWNVFGGFRTLSANIAVELPEAPMGGTHYRVLFLCGLVLFLMTFAVNTAAEVVRQVVRARTAGL